ncbi:peptide chain release factor I [Hyphomicrobium nitrativorans NL23]|uniref:Peptide chain release factor I n=1 Tax=Hyphomicrobium nitrativorans NL23 TaxID=1029756 RepID=V5SGP7_9HYPH|nr:alternative ribosome rescue aminoacyl-tRNA hydrolase ArfB [Hyphomicrobium nitrativorans]AHB49708.1 peptide chain release factor I [Hyphomicrobium nitrativorans NL23]
MLEITDKIAIDERELTERFIRASGPGGQNVNKVSTAVELRFDVRSSPSLPEAVRERLERLAGSRMTDEGVLIIRAERFRTQELNREDARARLVELVVKALYVPKRRVPTKPSRAAKARRVDSKVKRGNVKKLRQSRPLD